METADNTLTEKSQKKFHFTDTAVCCLIRLKQFNLFSSSPTDADPPQ